MNALDQASGQNWHIYNGDCIEVMAGLPENSIHYSVFSPPFASLYTYSNSDRDMGNCKDSPEFFDHFKFCVAQLFRVLKPGRLISMHCMDLPTSKVRNGYIGLDDFPGDLIRCAQAAGFIYHSRVCIWKDPVTAMQRTKAIGLLHKQIKKDSALSRQGIADYVVTMRKPGENDEPVSHTNETFPVGVWQKYASPVWMDIDPSDTLQYRAARDLNDERHIAPLQLGVIRRCIELWSNPNDVVFTPFLGIGSEVYAAVEMGRRGVGVELKPSYFAQAKKNVALAQANSRDLFSAA
jgi:DNA modification methylase